MPSWDIDMLGNDDIMVDEWLFYGIEEEPIAMLLPPPAPPLLAVQDDDAAVRLVTRLSSPNTILIPLLFEHSLHHCHHPL